MIDIPISEAEKFCTDYEKDQVIILAWDRTSGDTWVTTYGKSDEDSAMAANGANMVKDFLDLKREKDEIPKRFEKWELEITEMYMYLNGRYSKCFVRISYWYNPITLERKETIEKEYCNDGQEHILPDWTKSCEYRRGLNYI